MKLSAVPITALDPLTAYSLWKLRQDVFVVEQECPYPDLDGRDLEPGTRHVVIEDDTGAVLGCARVLDDGHSWRIGRVALHPTVRGQGWADRLMEAALPGLSRPGRRPRRADTAGRLVRARSASRSPARSSSTTGSRTCRCAGRRSFTGYPVKLPRR